MTTDVYTNSSLKKQFISVLIIATILIVVNITSLLACHYGSIARERSIKSIEQTIGNDDMTAFPLDRMVTYFTRSIHSLSGQEEALFTAVYILDMVTITLGILIVISAIIGLTWSNASVYKPTED